LLKALRQGEMTSIRNILGGATRGYNTINIIIMIIIIQLKIILFQRSNL
jgi:hypothetical protein